VGVTTDDGSRAATFERVLTETLESMGASEWTVQEQPIIGSFRPDILVRDASGRATVVEVKFGGGSSHFGWVAQLASLKRAVESSEGVSVARGILVTDRDVSEGLKQTAGELGVELVNAGSDDPSVVAAAVAEHLELVRRSGA
jgi:RecB family endonuclease NucS